MEDAEAKLEEMSKPYKVFSADVVDLAKANSEYKDILDFGIGDTVTMVSKHPKMREKQRIVKIVKYPETPEKNTVELSNTTKTFAEVQATETELAKTEAISISNSSTKKLLHNYGTKEEIETWITASKEAVELGVAATYQTIDAMSDYSTTKEIESYISLKTGEIELLVSEKVGADEIISCINQTPEKISINAGKIDLNGVVTANENFKILEDGSMEAKNGSFKGTITGALIQTGTEGRRVTIDETSAIKGYRNDEVFNILDLASDSDDTQMTLDAKKQLTIRTPKLAVINQSYGEEGGSAKVTKTGSMKYVINVEKDKTNCKEMWVNDVFCTLPVFLYVKYATVNTTIGMILTGETTNTDRV